MSINNPEVFPHPASQIQGITLFDMIMLSLISSADNGPSVSIEQLLDISKDILHLRNIAIQNLDNFKTMSQILKEEEENE